MIGRLLLFLILGLVRQFCHLQFVALLCLDGINANLRATQNHKRKDFLFPLPTVRTVPSGQLRQLPKSSDTPVVQPIMPTTTTLYYSLPLIPTNGFSPKVINHLQFSLRSYSGWCSLLGMFQNITMPASSKGQTGSGGC